MTYMSPIVMHVVDYVFDWLKYDSKSHISYMIMIIESIMYDSSHIKKLFYFLV